MRFKVLFLLLAAFAWHKYYVSVTVMQYNPHTRHLEIVLHTFPDDVERALTQNFRIKPDLDKADKRTKMFLETYLRQHFSLRFEGREVSYTFLGYTFENDQLLLLMETDSLPPREGQLEVYQSWLTDVYDSQQNLVHLLVGKDKQSAILNKDRTRTVFRFHPPGGA